jgi:Tol biopolymer transport system component
VASSDSTGVVSVTDENVQNFASRFYRVSNRPMPGDWWRAESIDATGRENVNTSALEGCPIESPDGRSLFFASNRAGGQGGVDIWRARRNGTHESWHDPVNLPPPVNSAFDDFCPTPLPDGELFFVSRRPGGCAENSADIYHTRLDPNTGWLDPAHLGCVVNSAGDEFSPSYVPAGGGMLFFSSDRDGMHKIYGSARQSGGSFGAPVEVTELNAPGFNTFRPNVSEDGLEIVFDSDRPGGLGGPDIWAAIRASASDTWRAPVNLGRNVNSDVAETRASLSRDGRRLTFGSTRPGGQGSSDIYVSSR